jgi:hypothetical protein
MDEMEKELQEQMLKGQEAETLYNHPLIQEFFQMTENAIINGMKKTKPDDYEKREEFFRMLKTLDGFKSTLQHFLDRGKNATTMLENLREGKFDYV